MMGAGRQNLSTDCSAEGCKKPRNTKGYCTMHYTRLRRHGNLAGKQPRGRTVEDRFWGHVEKRADPDACWAWTGATHSPFGYGMFGVAKKRVVGAHRFSYQLHFGAIPEGLVVCHRCDNPPCTRPDHLFLGTTADNIRDMYEKGRNRTRPPATQCPKGHPYDAVNTAYRKDGARACRICRKAWSKASTAKLKTQREKEIA